MDVNIAALVATLCTTTAVGVVAYMRAPDRPSNRLFAHHVFWVSMWTCTTLAVQCIYDAETIAGILRLAHFISACMVASFVDFIWVFPDRFRPAPRLSRIAIYVSGVVFGAIASLPPLIQRLDLTPSGPNVLFGWPILFFSAYAIPMVAHANVVLWRKVRTIDGVARVQTLYVFVGTLISETIILSVMVLIPLVTGSTAASRWGPLAYLVTVAAMGIAISKHHLWDMSSLARRGAAAAVSMGVVASVAAGAIWSANHWLPLGGVDSTHIALVWVSFGAMLGVLLTLMYNVLRGLFARVLQEERERIGGLLSALGSTVVHAPAGEGALIPVLSETQRFFGASRVRAYLRGPDGAYRGAGVVEAQGSEGNLTRPYSRDALPASVVRRLGIDGMSEPAEVGHLARFVSIREALEKLQAMETIGAAVVAPLQWQDETIGLIALGPKLSRDMYNSSDLDLLGSVAAHAAITVKNAELRAEILTEKERTESMLAEMESGVIGVDAMRVIRLVNPAACSLLGMSEDDLLDQRLDVLPKALGDHLRMAVDAGRPVSGARLYLDYERDLRVACSTFALGELGGKREGAGMVFRDLSTEDALHRAEQETERLGFIRAVSAGMAHEIRNPLVAIRTFAELAPTRLDDPEFRESFLQVAQSEVGRLEELVTQFMTLARPARAVREPVRIHDLIGNVVKSASAGAQAQDISIDTCIPGGLPELRGDETRLHQALMNLVLNAVDATPPGGEIQVSVEVAEDDTDDGCQLLITVWNSGSYIPADERQRVFEPFFTSKMKGTGLGLAICHTIAGEHGGATSVSSDIGDGTSFTISLPAVESAERAALRAS